MIRVDIKRCNSFNEFTKDEQELYFSHTRSSYIPHIDTFYYSCFLKGDDKDNPSENIVNFIKFLKEAKCEVDNAKDDIWLDFDKDVLFKRGRYKIYDFKLGKNQFFDIFVCSSLPNNSTPRVHIQLRSIGLWGVGEYDLINESYDYISSLLSDYDIEIIRTKENRVDYCYHTNSIQSPFKFYSDNNLKKHLRSTLSIYQKVGDIFPGEITIDYLSLGQRGSNNIFFRSYNKVQEVVKENYKGFFIDLWYNMGLISFYDREVYTYAYDKKSYKAIWFGMLEFYIKYGKNKMRVDYFIKLRDDPNTTYDDVKKLLEGFLPNPTLVINIEFQTMRKFYYYADDIIDSLPICSELDKPQLLRLYQILDNRKIFLDYLTSTTVSFVKDNKVSSKDIVYQDFWKRLRSLKLDKIVNMNFSRSYDKNLNYDILVSKLKSTLASLSLYKGFDNTDINDDMSLLFSILNDNDMVQLEDGTFRVVDNDYINKKEKRKKALKSYLNFSSPSKKK